VLEVALGGAEGVDFLFAEDGTDFVRLLEIVVELLVAAPAGHRGGLHGFVGDLAQQALVGQREKHALGKDEALRATRSVVSLSM
jgi:hypothetical protein